MKYKENDIIVCLSGFDNVGSWKDERTGGSGWVDGAIYKVKSVYGMEHPVLWLFDTGSGIYSQSCRLATDREIEAYSKGIRNIKNLPKDEIVDNYEIY